MKNPLYENSVNGPTVDLNTPLAVVIDFLEIESNDEVDWAGDDESPGFAAFPPPHVTDSPRPIDAPRTPEATQPPSPPPAPTIAKPVFAKQQIEGCFCIPFKEVIADSNIRRANIARRRQATRCLARQRIGEVPTLAAGFVDSASNWYTGQRTSTGTKRSSASDVSVEAKRSRRSPSTSRSHSDDEDLSDDDGLAAVGDSDDERPKNYKLSDDMREQVELFLDFNKTGLNLPSYWDFEAGNSRENYVVHWKLPFDDPDVMAINTSLCCRYMLRGMRWLWDGEHLYRFPLGRSVADMIRFETKVYCNILVRFFHIEFHLLVKGSDALVIRSLMDGDSGWENAAALLSFLSDLRMPALRNTGGRDPSNIVNPNSWFADEFLQFFKDVGAGFHSRNWCSEHVEDKASILPHRHLYLHATGQFWVIGSQLTRYHMMADLVGDTYWFPPAHQHVLDDEAITLQFKTIKQHIQQMYAADFASYDRYYHTIPGTYAVIYSMMDTATISNGELILRPLRPGEFEAIEEIARELAFVVTPIVILPPSAEAMGFEGLEPDIGM